MPKYFNLSQAERLLPAVGRAIRLAMTQKESFMEAENTLKAEMHRVAALGGAIVDRGRFASVKRSRDEAAEHLSRAVEDIHEFGCQVKDLDIGLIDFPTLYHGREVLLCWKLGEPGISFWHGLEEGFRGRKPIDGEFLANHEGDGADRA